MAELLAAAGGSTVAVAVSARQGSAAAGEEAASHAHAGEQRDAAPANGRTPAAGVGRLSSP